MEYPLTTGQVAVPWAPARQLRELVISSLHHDLWSSSLTVTLGRSRSIDMPPLEQGRVYFHGVLLCRTLAEQDIGEVHDAAQEPIQIITPSRLLAWWHQESQGKHLDEAIRHYRIIAGGQWVDLLTAREPELHLLPVAG
ncbi:MAG: hypothetical protein ACRC8D_09380 [Aeromonas sp.]